MWPEGEMEDLQQHVLGGTTTRRGFLKLGACSAISLAMVGAFGSVVKAAGFSSAAGLVILTNSKGLILANPTKCTGCRRCETACTEYNDGVSYPTGARIHVARNTMYGPNGSSQGGRLQGEYGNYLNIQDTCKQCPHPVPCATACPQGAIAADPATGARVVDAEKCIGCGLCTGACPWEMIQLDALTHKATKCFLCGECVAACPTSAITMIPWVDQTKTIPPRQSAFKIVGSAAIGATGAGQGCDPCHGKPENQQSQ